MCRIGDMTISGVTNGSAKMAGRDIVESSGGYGIGTFVFAFIVAAIVFVVVRFISHIRDGIASLCRGISKKLLPNADVKDMCKYHRDDVDVKPASKKDYKNHLKEDSIYPITKKPKGNVLILNNFKFAKEANLKDFSSGPREGMLIRKLFEGLGCEVEEANNKTAQEMQSKLTNFAKDSCHANADFSVVFILSHGARVPKKEEAKAEAVKSRRLPTPAVDEYRAQPINGDGSTNSDHNTQTDHSSKTDRNRSDGVDVFYGTDGDSVEVSYVIELFKDDKCTSLKNKPKLFFFEFCRIVQPRGGSDENNSASYLPSPTDMLDRFTQSRNSNQRTTTNDMLLTFTTQKGQSSYCNIFTNAMLNVFSKKSYKNSFTDMLKEVKRGMDKETSDIYQMAYTADYSLKSLYFFPGFPT